MSTPTLDHPVAYPELAAELARRGIVRSDLARVIGVHPIYLRNVLCGAVKGSPRVRRAVADILGRPESELFSSGTTAAVEVDA